MKVNKLMSAIVLYALITTQAWAALSIERKIEDPVLEAKAGELFRQIYCVVCTGQSLAESHVPLALDMKQFIRKEITAGKTEIEIKQQLVASYGDEILMKPPFTSDTYILWLSPIVMLLSAGVLMMLYLKSSTTSKTKKKSS